MKAVFVIDMLNDFVLPTGKLPVPGATKILEPIRNLITEALERNTKVIYICDAHQMDSKEFKSNGGLWPEHAVVGTPGAEIHRAFSIFKNKNILIKDDLSFFSNPSANMAELMKDIDHAIVVGVATEYCVHATVLGEKDRENNPIPNLLTTVKKVTVIENMIKSVDLNDTWNGDLALKAMREAKVDIIKYNPLFIEHL